MKITADLAAKKPFLLWLGIFLIFSPLLVGNHRNAYLTSPAMAQGLRVEINTDAKEEQDVESIFPNVDRSLTRRLRAAEEYLQKENYGDAARVLGSLLEELDKGEDVFWQAGPKPTAQGNESLKRHIKQLMESIPSAGQETVRDLFAPAAERQLNAALVEGNEESLALVARHFGFTAAGRQARLLLARHALDLGESRRAERILKQLKEDQPDFLEPLLSLWLACAQRDTGQPEAAQQTLLAARRDYPRPNLKLHEQNWTWFGSERDGLTWLASQVGESLPEADRATADWELPRGNVANHGLAKTSLPMLVPRWKQSLYLDDARSLSQPPLKDLVRQTEIRLRDNQVVAFPTREALVLPGQALVRLMGGSLRAFDIENGKLIWAYPPILTMRQHGASAVGMLTADDVRRTWEDLSGGRFTSDGELVFLIEPQDHSEHSRSVMHHRQGRPRPGLILETEGNLLTAIDASKQGKLLWSISGAEAAHAALSGCRFLGPPLPVRDKLYVLAETEDHEIRLLALEKKSGEVLWTQTIANPSDNFDGDALRQIAALTPLYSEGVIICPTASGALTAVDAEMQTLLWGYDYRSSMSGGARVSPSTGPTIIRSGLQDARSNPNWVENAVVIAGDKIVFAPLEDDHLHCVSLSTGKPVWQPIRREAHVAQLACVEQNHVILVGARKVQSIDLANGEESWKCDLTPGGVPVGRGLTTPNGLYLPLSSGVVWQLDFATGKVLNSAGTHGGAVLGNLAAAGEVVISVGAGTIDRFTELSTVERQVTERLREHPDDAAALITRAEVLREQRSYSDSLSTLRRAMSIASEKLRPLANRTLIETSLDALEADFVKYRAEVEPLAKDILAADQRARYLRCMAQGLWKEGARLEAVRQALALTDLPDKDPSLDSDAIAAMLFVHEDRQWTVHRDRWTFSRLEEIRESGNSADWDNVEKILSERLADAVAESSPEKLRRFLKVVRFPDWTQRAQLALAEKLTSPSDIVEREWLWWSLLRGSDDKYQPQATAALAQLYAEVGATPAAIAFYRKLADEYASTECTNGLTGKQIVEQLPEGDLRTAVVTPFTSLPDGQTEYVVDRKHAPGELEFLRDVRMRGDAGPLLAGGNLQLGGLRGILVGSDAQGTARFRIDLGGNSGEDESFLFSSRRGPDDLTAISHAEAYGHLILLWQGGRVLGMSALQSGDNSAAGGSSHVPLWNFDLTTDASPAQHGLRKLEDNKADWGESRIEVQDDASSPAGNLGPITKNGVCVQTRGGELLCLDPLTGKKLWQRKGLPLGCELIGDDEVLLALENESFQATVVRMSDGKVLESCKAPPRRRRMLAVGRTIIEKYNNAGENSIRRIDPWKGQVLWTRRIAEKTKATFVRQDLLAIAELPSRTSATAEKKSILVSVVRLSDGKSLIDQAPITAQTQDINSVSATQWGDYLVLLTTTFPPTNYRIDPPLAIPMGNGDKIVNGTLWGFNLKQGTTAWGPVGITDLCFWKGQPSGSPILALLASDAASAKESRSGERALAALCVDKRTGRIAYQTRGNDLIPPAVNNCELTYAPESATVLLAVPRHLVAMHLTSETLVAADSKSAQSGQPAESWKIPKELIHGDDEGLGDGDANPSEPLPKD